MANKRRVVVTGLGCVSPLGIGVKPTWEKLALGRSGIGRIKAYDSSSMEIQIAGEVKDFNFDCDMLGSKKKLLEPYITRAGSFGLVAAKEALEDASLINKIDFLGPVGISLGGHEESYAFDLMCDALPMKNIIENMKAHRVNVDSFPYEAISIFVRRQAINSAFLIGAVFGLNGPAVISSCACAASSYAIGEAKGLVERGYVDVAITGGTEAYINEMTVGCFSLLGVLSKRNDEPGRASRPFDKDRDGFVMGEGGAILIIEELGHAKKRGAKIYGELLGFGTSSNAYRITDTPPDGTGPDLAMMNTLKDADLGPQDIDYINAHGTSTLMNDISEVQAIKKVFGDHARNVAISSTKSMIGHLIAGAGAVEAMVCLLSINEGIVHPTINLENQDSRCDLDFVPLKARKANINVSLSNSFGFGGQNACLIFSKYEE